MTDLEEYEKAYLERLKKKSGKKPKPKTTSFVDESLIPSDYVLMGLLRNGISKLQTMYARLPKMSVWKINSRLEEMKNSIGVKIDSNVTSDIHRIFRLEGSLNSKSSLVKLVCQDIEKFNPYIEACLIEGKPVEVLANFPIKFSLINTNFGPYMNDKTSVPKYAAAYMVC